MSEPPTEPASDSDSETGAQPRSDQSIADQGSADMPQPEASLDDPALGPAAADDGPPLDAYDADFAASDFGAAALDPELDRELGPGADEMGLPIVSEPPSDGHPRPQTLSQPMTAPSGANRPSASRALKTPPQSLEAEQSVLGGLMLDASAWFKVADKVEPEDFYRNAHQLIFRAMLHLSETNQQLDAVTLMERLVSTGKLKEVGGYAYLLELSESTPGVTNIAAYADIVKERATLRRLIDAAQSIADSAFTPEGRSSDELLNEAEHQIFQIAEGRLREGGPKQVAPLLVGAVKRVQELTDSGSRITGVATGFDQLDTKTAGLQPSDLVIVAGRPSMGKTSFAMNLVEHAVMDDKKDGAVLVFSLEMPSELLMMRLLSSLGRIDQSRLRTGQLKDQDWAQFTSAVSLLRDRPLYVDDAPNLSPNDLRTRAHRVRRQEGGKLKMIMVDYLQLMRGSGQSDNRTGEISEISRSLKALAKEMECPVIALSQLNRALENRTDRRPVMADLRESGAIEQDADVILFIYRDEVYNDESPDKGVAEIIIGKQRNGPIGTVKLAFLNHLTKFENLAPDRYDHEGFQ